MLFLRALLAFLLLPCTVGALLPWWIANADRMRGGGSRVGGVVTALGVAVVLWCVRDFYAAGKGTLAPWDPPRHLVVVGLYRYVRNPMYVGVLTVVVGLSIYWGSTRLAVYAVVLAVAFHLRTVLYEEPRLARQFGAEWEGYQAAVSRWKPRASPWTG